MPAWEDIVTAMYNKGLDGWSDEIVHVMYNSDNTKRFVILKSERGYYKYVYEILYQFDEEEWMYIGSQPEALPAMWEPTGSSSLSLFSDIDEIIKAVKALPEYRLHFSAEK